MYCTERHDPKKFSLGHTPACITKLTEKEFYEKYCQMCGSQRCEGMGTEWFDGCRYRYELEGYVDDE